MRINVLALQNIYIRQNTRCCLFFIHQLYELKKKKNIQPFFICAQKVLLWGCFRPLLICFFGVVLNSVEFFSDQDVTSETDSFLFLIFIIRFSSVFNNSIFFNNYYFKLYSGLMLQLNGNTKIFHFAHIWLTDNAFSPLKYRY